MTELAGRRALVTGASSGIGALASMMLALRGCRVVGNGRNFASTAGSAVTPLLETVIERDLTEPSAPEEVIETAFAALGGLDVVVANAGAGWSGPYESMTPEELDWALDLNLRVPMHMARAAAAHLRRSRGQLVLVGSIAGKVGVPTEAAYATAKHGLAGLAESLRAEWAPAVSVSLVSPGVIATPFFGRRNQPYLRHWPKPVPAATAARAVVRAVERRPAEVFVPYWVGPVSWFHGGLPGIYRLLAQLFEPSSRAV